MIKLTLDQEKLNGAMIASRLSVRDLCVNLQVSRSAVSAWRSGSGLSLATLAALSEILRVSPRNILSADTLRSIEYITQ